MNEINRDASRSFNGYLYQRYYSIYFILTEQFEYI